MPALPSADALVLVLVETAVAEVDTAEGEAKTDAPADVDMPTASEAAVVEGVAALL